MTISNEIIKVLEYLGAKFGVAIDWTSSNVMPFINQLMEKYISWEISTSIAWIVITSIVLLLSIVFGILDLSNDWTDGCSFILIIPLVVSMLVLIGSQIFDIITCVKFPELQIIEYIQYLIKVHS